MTSDIAIKPEGGIIGYAQNLNQSLQFCAVLIKSGLVPQSFKTPEAAYVAILYGQELGFSPIQSLNSVYVIGGKPALEASGIKALIVSKGGTVRTEGWDATSCTLTMTRPGWTEQTSTYSIDMAKRAGLAEKDNWKKSPEAMVYARCVSILARNMFPDVLKGFYCKEELEDIDAPTVISNTRISEIIKDKKESVKHLPTSDDREERIMKMVDAFQELDVNYVQIEEMLKKPVHDCTDDDITDLQNIYKKIRKGEAKSSEYFVEGLVP